MPQDPAKPSRLRKWLFRVLAMGCVLAACYVFRAPLLAGLAKLWIVNQPLQKADAIVVLGGGLDTRPLEAARLYQQGLAPRILLLNVRSNKTDQLGITIPETDLAMFLLLKSSVPEDAITIIGHGVTSTRDECLAVRHWAEDNHPNSLLFPTEPFHTRRVKFFFGRILKETGTEVRTEAVTVEDYSASNWWQHEKGMIAFQNEVLKFVYYLIKY